MANMGLVASNWHLLSHTATMVAVTTSMISGAVVAVAVGGLGAGRVPVAGAAAAGVPSPAVDDLLVEPPHRGLAVLDWHGPSLPSAGIARQRIRGP